MYRMIHNKISCIIWKIGLPIHELNLDNLAFTDSLGFTTRRHYLLWSNLLQSEQFSPLLFTNHWLIQQLDANNVLLNGYQNEVYMQQPSGLEATDSSLVCKLYKALYGLKQAPRAWFERLQSTLLQFGFTASKCYPSLFILHGYSRCLFCLEPNFIFMQQGQMIYPRPPQNTEELIIQLKESVLRGTKQQLLLPAEDSRKNPPSPYFHFHYWKDNLRYTGHALS